MGGGGSNRARPCMISSRDLLTFNLGCYLWPMLKYDLAQKEQYGGWRKELEGKCHPQKGKKVNVRLYSTSSVGPGAYLRCLRWHCHTSAVGGQVFPPNSRLPSHSDCYSFLSRHLGSTRLSQPCGAIGV